MDFEHHYNWIKTISYDADVTCVIAARGPGKTYGLRGLAVLDYLKKGYRFVEVCRHKDDIPKTAGDYFEKLVHNNEFPGYQFMTQGTRAYISRIPEEGKKAKWELIGYFASLSGKQQSKKQTYVNVRKVIVDEAILETDDQYHHYLPDEWGKLCNLVSSIERKDVYDASRGQVRVYLIGNACDLVNPYFVANGIRDIPQEGYTWHNNKLFLLHYYKDAEYAELFAQNTLAGRMARGTADEAYMGGAEFVRVNKDFIASKPKNAKFQFGIRYKGVTYGIWCDEQEGYMYVNTKVPNNNPNVLALTASDNRINLIAAKRSNRALQAFVDLYYAGIVRYDSPATQEKFLEAMAICGIR